MKIAKEILEDIKTRGEEAVAHHATRLGDVKQVNYYIFVRVAMY